MTCLVCKCAEPCRYDSGLARNRLTYSRDGGDPAGWCGSDSGISETFHAQAASNAAPSLICQDHLVERVGLAVMHFAIVRRD